MIDQREKIENPPKQASQTGPRHEVAPQGDSKLCQYIEQKPMQSVLIGLGVGIGAGLILGSVVRGSARYLTYEEVLTERIGNQVKNSLREIVPASVMKHFRS